MQDVYFSVSIWQYPLVSHKCDLCGGDPRCVTHCISGALQFEDVEDAVTRKRYRIDMQIEDLTKRG